MLQILCSSVRVNKECNTFELILIFEVMIDIFHSTDLILSCQLGIYILELLLCVIWVRHAHNVMINLGPVRRKSLT